MGKKSRRIKRVHKSIKHIGLICAYFASVQAIIWILLTVAGIVCFFLKCGSGTLAVSFRGIYMNYNNLFSSRSCIVPPLVFLILLGVYLVLSFFWLSTSCNVIVVFREWSNFRKIRTAGTMWIVITAIVCFVDLVVFAIFLYDFICMHNHSGESRSFSRSYDFPYETNVKRTRIEKLREEIKTIDKPLENETVENILNPFIQEKIWEKVPWPTKQRPKKKGMPSSKTIEDDVMHILNIDPTNKSIEQNLTNWTNIEARSSIGQLTENLKHFKMLNEEQDNNSEGSGRLKPKLPPIICMIVAIKGLIAWIANVVLMVYLKRAMKNLTVISPFFQNWFRFCGILKGKLGKKKRRRRR